MGNPVVTFREVVLVGVVLPGIILVEAPCAVTYSGVMLSEVTVGWSRYFDQSAQGCPDTCD